MAGTSRPVRELAPHQVVVRPLVTEKGTFQSERFNAYTFEVSPQATKTQIREAVESRWDGRVVDVRTQNRKGKPRRTRLTGGHTKSWKKAIVQLHEEDRIAFF